MKFIKKYFLALLVFGLGSLSDIGLILIAWPSGAVQEIAGEFDLAVNQRYKIVENDTGTDNISLDVRLKNEMSFKTEYKKSRQLRLELIGTGRLHESKGEEFTVNFGYKLKETQIAFLKPKKKKKADPSKDKNKPSIGKPGSRASQNTPGDMDFTFNLSIRDDVTNIRELVTGLVEPNRGSRRVSFAPAIQYQLSDQLSLRFFFDYNKNTPKTSQGYPTTNIRSGVTVRFAL